MKRILFFALIHLGMLVSACSPSLSATDDLSSATEIGAMRLEMPADADVADIPLLMAVDSLKEQGYALQTMSFADTATQVTAMAQGDLDISQTSNQIAWAAISKGAPLVTLMDMSANTYLVITGQDIKTCADLDGKSMAVPTVSAVSAAMFTAYVERECPAANPQVIIISGGSSRTAALLAGEVDAAIQDVDDLLKLERERPGEFHSLVAFAEEFPGLQIDSLLVHRDFAEQHPEMVRDVIRALFAARRTLQDPKVLREAIVGYLDVEADTAQQIADIYLAHGIWDASGTYTLETVQANLDFLQEHGDLAPELEAEDVADLSYYEAVLDEIGRQ